MPGHNLMMPERTDQTPNPHHFLSMFYTRKLIEYLGDTINELPINKNILRNISGRSAAGITRMTCRQVMQHINRKDARPEQTAMFRANIKVLCNLFGVPVEFAPVLEFITVININYGLKRLIINLDDPLEDKPLEWLLASLSGMQIEEVAYLLNKLYAQGFFQSRVWVTEPQDIEIPLAVLSVVTTQRIDSKVSLLQNVLSKSPASTLSCSQFDYVDTELLLGYLGEAVDSAHTGVNILLYGEAGSGKTELARVLARELQLTLYEGRNLLIEDGRVSNEFGAKSADTQRLQYVAAIQKLLKDTSATLLLVDECESLFSNADRHYSKETVHRLLETNQVPCIWITNHIDQLEDSYIRRFKLAIEVKSPEKAALAAISKATLKGLSVAQGFHQQLGQTKNLTPAIIANAGYIAKTLGFTRKAAERVIGEVIEHTLSACGLWDDTSRYQPQLAFDIDLLNIKQPATVLKEISQAVANDLPVRVLISGPPGSGKTAFAHHLAQQHQRELKRVLSSDVLDKYVGGSEQRIAELFHQAEQQNQFLLLDEVDSLLTSRDQLSMQHERQVVNELLAQIECFTQPLFAATNFETLLDKAVLRRFDFKLECDYLTAEQVFMLYKRTLGVSKLTADESQQLQRLSRLTPGDFAILARRMLFQPKQQHRLSAISILAEENQRKHTNPTIGFVQ
ncbi:ATP-binding protein [Rheinheimera hassiensis]|uniref:ATP-binding protein n=1 Tax=Rheinheimera hassiensis TaxID=1193627 RepID=UPI001F05EB2B|nr:ATP-binding protein [Rheinheimera hassiensis]